MEKSVSVRILGKDYSLRVKESQVDFTLEVASNLDTRMRAFQAAHPKAHELTTAVITALSVTEELYQLKQHADETDSRITRELFAMDTLLAKALGEEVSSKIQLDLEPQEV
ncbi:MAG: cell division protein ZapA [Rhodothermales bacterium]|nr:cell division protein ZapA [Rhodothermales bacterium]